MEDPGQTRGRTGGPARAVRPALPLLLTLAISGVLAFLSGGYIFGRSTPVVVVFLLAAIVVAWVVRTWTRPSWLFVSALSVFAAFAAWELLSVTWSIAPDLTWIAFNVTAFYVVVVAFVGLASIGAAQLRIAAWSFLAVCVVVGGYAYLGKVVPATVTHAHDYARLLSPVGYWNVLALFMVMGIPVALALAADSDSRLPWRMVAAGSAVLLAFTLFFCFSRGSLVVLAVTLVLYFGFSTTRLASFWSLLAVVAPVAFALWRVRDLETLFTETTNDALRTAQGATLLRWSILALVIAVVAEAVAVLLQKRIRWPGWSTVTAGALLIVLLVGGGSLGAARFVSAQGGTAWVKDRVHAFVNDSTDARVGNDVARLGSVTTLRPTLWREALDQSRTARAAGTGGGTFPYTHYRFRTNVLVVKHAHSEWFNVLSELGVTGLVLLLAAVVLLLAAAVGNPFARRDDPLHSVLVAAQVAAIAFVVHMSWDWTWDIASAGVAAFAMLGVCAAYQRGRRAADPDPDVLVADAESPVSGPGSAPSGSRLPWHHGWAPRVVASVALLLLALSWMPPYLSERASNDALDSASRGRTEVALQQARRAAGLDPLAAQPLLTGATMLQQLGRSRDALELLDQAARLQPAYYKVWYQLGVLQGSVLGRKKAAAASFRRALRLNPQDSRTAWELNMLLGSR